MTGSYKMFAFWRPYLETYSKHSFADVLLKYNFTRVLMSLKIRWICNYALFPMHHNWKWPVPYIVVSKKASLVECESHVHSLIKSINSFHRIFTEKKPSWNLHVVYKSFSYFPLYLPWFLTRNEWPTIVSHSLHSGAQKRL